MSKKEAESFATDLPTGVGALNPFAVIMRAFDASQFDILRDNAAAMGRIKRALRRRKDEAFGPHMDGGDREILEYPVAR